MEIFVTIILWAVAIALLAFGGMAGFGLVAIWFGGGLYMIANSRSRGLWADASFLVTWPIYMALNR